VDREQVLFRLFGKYCPEGTILSTEGSPGHELYVIQSGAVRVGPVRPPGDREGLLGPGDLLGEGSLFTRPGRSPRAEVVQDARLIQVGDRTLEQVARHGPQTARLIFEQLLALSRGARDELDRWTVGQLLRRVGPNLEANTGPGATAADLAEQTGLTEPDVVLVLEDLCAHGLLVREGAVYRAPDTAALRRGIEGYEEAGQPHGASRKEGTERGA
jgi:CRP-like cAMP-binding protein